MRKRKPRSEMTAAEKAEDNRQTKQRKKAQMEKRAREGPPRDGDRRMEDERRRREDDRRFNEDHAVCLLERATCPKILQALAGRSSSRPHIA